MCRGGGTKALRAVQETRATDGEWWNNTKAINGLAILPTRANEDVKPSPVTRSAVGNDSTVYTHTD